MRVTGWKIEGVLPDRPKFIIAVAPHSSNFDFMLTVMVIWSTGIRASFLAKASLFRFPLSVVMNHFGGIPVSRSSVNGMVEQMVELFQSRPKLILGIAPEGTHAAVTHWRKRFCADRSRRQCTDLASHIGLPAQNGDIRASNRRRH